MIDWVPIGPRFSNGVLQALIVLMGRRPPKVSTELLLSTTPDVKAEFSAHRVDVSLS